MLSKDLQNIPGSIKETKEALLGAQEAKVPQDSWQHRSVSMQCSSCMWYVAKAGSGRTVLGRCRRHAPTMNGYPVVFPTDWCGDHKLDERVV